jgi:hypothetical protein
MLYPPGAVERAMHVREIITRALDGQLTWIRAAEIRGRSPAASGDCGRSSRPFWGWVSDHIGRYNTLAIAFAAKAAAILAFLQLVHDPIWSRG